MGRPSTQATPSGKRRGSDARVMVEGISVSHPGRLMYPDAGITKLEVAEYYAAIAPAMVPHVQGRPLTLVRCGDGLITGQMRADCTFMRHGRVWGPSALRRVSIQEKTKVGEYLVADDAAGLVGLAQMDVLEIHTWNSRIERVELPDRLVFDLDPGPDVPWARVVEAALLVRDTLAGLGLESWVKTTGGVGVHVVVPFLPREEWNVMLGFARAVCTLVARDRSEMFTTSMAKADRPGRIFLDYLRNGRANTAVAAYSTRARAGATVSTPLSWEELRDTKHPDVFDIHSVRRRVMAGEAPWKGYFTARQRLPAAIARRLR